MTVVGWLEAVRKSTSILRPAQSNAHVLPVFTQSAPSVVVVGPVGNVHDGPEPIGPPPLS